MSPNEPDEEHDDAEPSQRDEKTEEMTDAPVEPSNAENADDSVPAEATARPRRNRDDEPSDAATDATPRPVESMRRENTDIPSLVSLSGARAGESTMLDSSETTLGRNRGEVDVWFADPAVSRLHAAVRRLADGSYRIRDLDSANGTYLNRQRIDSTRRLRTGDKIVLGRDAILKFATPDSLAHEFHDRAYESAVRDRLTGANTRAYLEEQMVSAIGLSERHGDDPGTALLMLDIDNFKEVNDTHGHPVGDALLTEFAELCQAEIRAEDVFARYGGEEFAALLRMAEHDSIAEVSERLRATVESQYFDIDDRAIQMTVSIGAAHYRPSRTGGISEWTERADRALYDAKEAGRNCVRMAPCASSSVLPDRAAESPA